MRIPAALPFDLALFNALHGVPRFGVFAPFPCPQTEIAAWSLLIPWAIRALGPLAGRALLVLPPTPMGIAFLLDALQAHVLVAEEAPLPLVAALQARVATVTPAELPPACVEGLLALSVGPRGAQIEDAFLLAARVLAPGGRRVLAWRERDELEICT